MDSDSSRRTSVSLLFRLRGDTPDQKAWVEFVRRYGSWIFQWCRHWNLNAGEAEEVTQLVMVKLAEKMCTFGYDPARSFRAYLKTLTHYAWCDFLGSCERPGSGSGDSRVLRSLDAIEARDDLVGRLNEEFDQELLDEAMGRVRQCIEAHTWEAFRLTAIERRSGAEVAEQLGVKVGTVFKAKSKVQRMLRDELARSEDA